MRKGVKLGDGEEIRGTPEGKRNWNQGAYDMMDRANYSFKNWDRQQFPNIYDFCRHIAREAIEKLASFGEYPKRTWEYRDLSSEGRKILFFGNAGIIEFTNYMYNQDWSRFDLIISCFPGMHIRMAYEFPELRQNKIPIISIPTDCDDVWGTYINSPNVLYLLCSDVQSRKDGNTSR